MGTSPGAQVSTTLSISTISEDLSVIGNVTSTGELHLSGQIRGDVRCVALVLGENGQLVGNVVAEDVMVRGRLLGSVHALTVTLQASSHMEGDLFHKNLSIEQGAYFGGESHPSENPLSSSREVAEPEPNPDGRPDVAKQKEQATSFVRSFPESRSA
jgi:cytoskeletal protein CcmA (bactofilin family)